MAFKLKKYLYMPLVLARHGSLSPTEVSLPVTGHRIALNPRDERAYKKIVMDSARGRRSIPMQFWRDHILAVSPSLCADIGANYGECTAFARYTSGTTCLTIEANPTLLPFLEKTRAAHPDAPRIILESCLLGDTDKQESALYFHETWTGGGSAIEAHADMTKTTVTTRTMDSLIAQHRIDPKASLVFKMDVEGYEGKVIDGFSSLFNRDSVVGIMEFDTVMLTRAGTDPKTLFETLASRFAVYLTTKKEKALRKVLNWNALCTLHKNDTFHCDLAVFSQPSLMAPGWLATDR
jgi:FkbM family methyltransferase